MVQTRAELVQQIFPNCKAFMPLAFTNEVLYIAAVLGKHLDSKCGGFRRSV